MFFIRKPSAERIREFIATQSPLPFSYEAVGASQGDPPRGYVLDHNRVRLGSGRDLFQRAREAVRRWEMFRLSWVQLCWPDTPIRVGAVVAVLGRACGLWSLNACRIVYLIEQVGSLEKFGFAYGTLPDHMERGEERFSVEWHHADDSVWYDILAFSRPNKLVARMGYPIVRSLQKRFARESKEAMCRAVCGCT